MIILDTHVLVWWVSGSNKLSEQANALLQKESEYGQILISSITVLELYTLVEKGKLQLTMDIDSWLKKVEGLPFVQVVPVDQRIAAKAASLPEGIGEDLADRIIVATANEKGAVLVSSDEHIQNYSAVRSVW